MLIMMTKKSVKEQGTVLQIPSAIVLFKPCMIFNGTQGKKNRKHANINLPPLKKP